MNFIKTNTSKNQSSHATNRINRTIIIILSAIASLLIGVILVLSGLEKTLFDASSASTNSKTYLSKVIATHNYSLSSTPNNRILTSRSNITLSPDITNDIISYQGQIAGTLTTYHFDWPRQVISPSATKSLLPDLDIPTTDKIPILISSNASYPAEVQADIDKFFTVVGTIPGPNASSYPYLIDTGSLAIDSYLSQLTQSNTDTISVAYSIIISFNDPFFAIGYAKNRLFADQNLHPATDFIGNTLGISSIFGQIYMIYWIIASILFIATLIAIAFLLNRSFRQQSSTKNSSSLNHAPISISTFIKLSLASAIISIVIGSLISLLTNIIGSHGLAASLQSAYHLSAQPSVHLFRISHQLLFILIGFILVVLFGISILTKKSRIYSISPKNKSSQSISKQKSSIQATKTKQKEISKSTNPHSSKSIKPPKKSHKSF